MEFGAPTPILRILDEAKAREFYEGFLGFTLRLGAPLRRPNTRIYAQVSRGGCILHLSEHHGDGIPGNAFVRVPVTDIETFQRELIDKKYKYMRPGIQDSPGARARW